MSKIITSARLLCLSFLIFTFTAAAAFEPMLPQTYTPQATIDGWGMSEKLDGIRGYRDGSQLFRKNGTRLTPSGTPPRPSARSSPINITAITPPAFRNFHPLGVFARTVNCDAGITR